MKTLIFRDSKTTGPAKNTKAKRVLIVEDDQALETILTRVVQSISNGAIIDWATSVQEARNRLRVARNTFEKDYDLIIADIFLEGNETGIEFWQQCQFICPTTPMLLTSSMPMHEFFKAIGRNAISPPFLPKPFQVSECQQMIEGLLRYQAKAA